MKLKSCPFCGGRAELVVRNPKQYGATGAYVECTDCGARTRWNRINDVILMENAISTPITEQSIESGRKNAAKCWNNRVERF